MAGWTHQALAAARAGYTPCSTRHACLTTKLAGLPFAWLRGLLLLWGKGD